MSKKIYASSFIHKDWKVFLAASTNGLCFLGTDHSSFPELQAYCNKQFPNCEVYENKEFLLPYINEIIEYLDGNRTTFSIPFDIRGTAFQINVWNALCDIPFGQTKCYSDIANEIGNPKAVRAVGTAIGANPLSIIIPCHRVLGRNGSLTGYNGGLDIKERLLKLEGIMLNI